MRRDLVRERKAVKFAAIADWADSGEFPVTFMCHWLGVSRSGYYAWRHAAPSARARQDERLLDLVCAIHRHGRGNPGVRRIRASLAASGHQVSSKRVWRLMKAAGLQGRHRRAYKPATTPGAGPVLAPDRLQQDFSAQRPDEKWCGDITYVKTRRGWAYTATVIDLYSRRIVGYAVAEHMRTSLITDALDMALMRRKPPAGLIFHADHGTQFTSKEFAAYCTERSIKRSLGRTGVCYDNAVAESTFASYKKELIHTRPWPDVPTVATESADWFDTYYNTISRHSYLGYLTPQEFELGYTHIQQLAA